MLAESDFGIELPMKELIFEYLTERRALDRIVLEYPGNKTLGFFREPDVFRERSNYRSFWCRPRRLVTV